MSIGFVDTLCHGEGRRDLKITVFDYEKKSRHRWMGEKEVTMDQLVKSVTRGGNACREDVLMLIEKKGDVVGLLVVLKADVSLLVSLSFGCCDIIDESPSLMFTLTYNNDKIEP